MSKKNGWIPLDKNLSQYLPYNRPYTRVEAMFSYTKDLDNNKEGTILGYSNQWQWGRNKVRKFIVEIKEISGFPKGHPKGQQKDTPPQKKGHPIHYIDKALWDIKDTPQPKKGQQKDTPGDISYNPILNPNPKKEEKKDIYVDFVNKFWEEYPERKGKKTGKKDCYDFIFKTIKKEDFDILLKHTINYNISKQENPIGIRDPIRFLKKDYWREWDKPENNQTSECNIADLLNKEN